jgi:GT2 family glycosyltransferase
VASISWVILTYNRGEIVKEALSHCFDYSGAPEAIEEVVWVDNGSTDKVCREFMRTLEPEVSVLLSDNLGVARGYNIGMGLATKDYIVITGCDMKMPANWLRTMLDYVERVPETGVASVYSIHWTARPERLRKGFGIKEINGMPLVHAMPIERRIFRRELLADFGYFPETLGLYGYDDLCWAYRTERICDQKGLLYYVIPDLVAEHLGTEGINAADGKDSSQYHAFKQKEVRDPRKREEMDRLKELGWPRFSPFL